jgi:hypothetical protein
MAAGRFLNHKYLIFLLFSIVFLPGVHSVIQLTDPMDSYMFGDYVHVNASVSYTHETYGFFKLFLKCNGNSQQYFTVPLLLKPNSEAKISPEPVRITTNNPRAAKECYVLAKFEDERGKEIFSKKSAVFKIINSFDADISLEKDILSPGEEIVFSVKIKTDKDAFKGISADLIVDRKLFSHDIEKPEFKIKYELPDNIQLGKQYAVLELEDEHGNQAKRAIEFKVQLIPFFIKHVYSKDNNSVGWNQTIRFKTEVYDSSNRKIEGLDIVTYIIDPNGKEVARKNVTSFGDFEMQITSEMIPGEYSAISYHDGPKALTEKTLFEVINEKYDISKERAYSLNNSADKNNLDDKKSKIGSNTNKTGLIPLVFRYAAVILIMVVFAYLAYSYGRRVGKKTIAQKKSSIFRKDEF